MKCSYKIKTENPSAPTFVNVIIFIIHYYEVYCLVVSFNNNGVPSVGNLWVAGLGQSVAVFAQMIFS